jgi:hypothetical protein
MIEKQLPERTAPDPIIVTDRIHSRQEISVDKRRFLRGGHSCYAVHIRRKRRWVRDMFYLQTTKAKKIASL